MHDAISSPYLIPFDDSFKIKDYSTKPASHLLDKKANKHKLATLSEQLSSLQKVLYAQNQYSLLIIFQAMDAAGKDSTIRAVMEFINPAGCQVYSFQAPSTEERSHDFIWRTGIRLPQSGRIGIFNRSYYEEVLIVRVHPELLNAQRLPKLQVNEKFWDERLESIQGFEKHLAKNGTVILKFWLNISKKEQKKRFLSRIDDPVKNWKFTKDDIKERKFWDDYMFAYEQALSATSKPWAPWYAIPADDKPYMRTCVSDIIVATLKSLGLTYPRIDHKEAGEFDKMRKLLENEE